MIFPSFIDDIRRAQKLMTISEVQKLVSRGNVIYDPFSVLIASTAKIGTGNVIFPCVSFFCGDKGELSIGDNNTFFGSTLVEATSGSIVIGSGNQFGEGGFTAKTNRPAARITIGDDGRYLNGAAVFGTTTLGTGSQILGAITVDNCHLEAGQPYWNVDPNHRAGLLKGVGIARNLTVPIGQVILGNGSFSADDLKAQSFFHPGGQ